MNNYTFGKMSFEKGWKTGVTLRELVNRQKFTDESDGELISAWFNGNNMALEGIKIVSQIAENKIKDDERKLDLLVGDLSMYSATESLLKTFGKKDGLYLDSIIRRWLISYRLGENFIEVYSRDFDWLKENMPKYDLPSIFWQPFVKWLNENGIFFKDQKEKENG